MANGWARHLFPGGNTAYGFHSFYSEIITQEEARRIIVLKGGPGVVKSTFIRRIGEAMLERGYDTEFLHCSSDNNSLDGIVIPALKTAVIDGTAPHVVDPKNPAAVDEILNFGDFWDAAAINQNKENILSLTGRISAAFARAYRYLKAAHSIAEDSAAIYAAALDWPRAGRLAQDLAEKVFGNEGLAEKSGKTRSLFLSAITPNGLVHYIDDSIAGFTTYSIRGTLGLKSGTILERIRSEASVRGYACECFFCALDPKKMEHLIIPQKKTAFVTVNEYHTPRLEVREAADMNDFLDKASILLKSADINTNREYFGRLLDTAVEAIASAKQMHDELETYYKPHIDFAAVDACLKKTVGEILQ